MKLVDIFIFSKDSTTNNKNKSNSKTSFLQKTRIDHEKLVKLRETKRFLFGKFSTVVNIFKYDRYFDIPLPSSFSEPYYPERNTVGVWAMVEGGKNCIRVNGQNLVGDMIPTLTKLSQREAPVGEFIKHVELLPDDSEGKKIDSVKMAFAKIAILVYMSGFISWYTLPVLIKSTHTVFQSYFDSQ